MEDQEEDDFCSRTVSVAIPRVKHEYKQTFQLNNAGGDYIKTKLPKDFYEKITLGEMSLEYDFSIEKLTKLTDLYSLGIQYFLENNPAQAKAFQDRMGIILTNKEILAKLKKQQDEEKNVKEVKNKKKDVEKKNKNEENKVFPKSSKILPKAIKRKRALTNFIVKSQNLNSEVIKKKVSFVLNKDIDKEKEEKKNVKNLINEELNKQNLKWKEKLKKKKMNKRFQTPGVNLGRGVLALKSPVIMKMPSKEIFADLNNPKNNNDLNMLDNESSEMDWAEKNEGDIDFLKLFKERHCSKDKDDDNIDTFKIDDYQNENNEAKNKEESVKSGLSSDDEYLKKIDEVDEEKEAMSLRQTAKMGEINKINSEVNFENYSESSVETKISETKKEPSVVRMSIVDAKNVIRKIEPDNEIKEIVEQKMKNLENLNNNNVDDEINGAEESSEQLQDLKMVVGEIPVKFQETYNEVEKLINKYVKDLKNHFYKDTFEVFSLELKDLYDRKYKKYIEVSNEYHNNIKESEYHLENDENISEEEKLIMPQIIDSLKEEQKDQIDKITDEYNELIDKKINDFKMTFYKKDFGINLMEEQLKLDIYTMINEAFY